MKFARFWSVDVVFLAALGLVVVPAFCQLLNTVLFSQFDIHRGLADFYTCFVLGGPLFSIGSTVFYNLFQYEQNTGNPDHYNGAGAYAMFDTLQTLDEHVVS
ncbi:MAG: hypothetical protein RI575_18245, partial [Balneolaceae bacterium]|nr:hypothetical protein [Balneolaceae bacterium]